MSVGNIFSDYLQAHYAASALNASVSPKITHHWGHMSFDDVVTSVGSHHQQTALFREEMRGSWDGRAALAAKDVRRLRARIGERLRSNHYYRTAVDLKLARVSKKYSDEIAQDRTDILTGEKHGLADERRLLKNSLTELQRACPESKSEKLFTGLLRFSNGLRCSAYRHPVGASVVIAALALLAPIYLVYNNMQPLHQTAD